MAINVPNHGYPNWADQFDFTYKDVAIGGKMVRGTIRIPEHKVAKMYSDHEFREYTRTSMATQLAEYMISNGLVEFTQMRDNISLDIIVNARCYLAPSDQVKILRMNYAL